MIPFPARFSAITQGHHLDIFDSQEKRIYYVASLDKHLLSFYVVCKILKPLYPQVFSLNYPFFPFYLLVFFPSGVSVLTSQLPEEDLLPFPLFPLFLFFFSRADDRSSHQKG